MKLSAPTQVVWIIALVVGILGLLGFFAVLPPLAPYAFWMVTIAFGLLAVATAFRGL